MSGQYGFDAVDAFTAGAVGEPGARVFYLQVSRGSSQITVKCEKEQVAAVAQHLGRLLNDLPTPTGAPADIALQFTAPDEVAFVLGPVGLGYDRDNDRLVLRLEEVVAVDENGDPIDDPDDPLAEERGAVRVMITREQAHAFCRHAIAVIAAGRPPCRWCARPVEPEGHVCPRMN